MKLIETNDGSHTLHSEHYGETYHSTHGATTEARHVYLDASGVTERLQNQRETRLLEIGFGLGLNCLLTADMAIQYGCALHYHAVEHNLGALRAIPTLQYERWLHSPALLETLMAGLAETTHATPHLDPCNLAQQASRAPTTAIRIPLASQVTLTLHPIDAATHSLPAGLFDAIYLDAFSPDNNPECWTPEFLTQLFTRTAPHGILTTYSAKGSVRRALLSAGYSVKKMMGPPGKREMLHASLLK